MSKQRQPRLVLCELAETGLDATPSYSPFCTKAIAALRRAKLSYTSRRAAQPAAFKALNPQGQVPVLLIDEQPVADSTTIIERIEALSDAPMSAPLNATEQAEALLWEDYADTALSGFLVAARWADDDNWPRTEAVYFADLSPAVRDEVAPRARQGVICELIARDVWRAGADACWMRFEHTLEQLDTRAPVSGFWVSETVSVADIALYAMLAGLQTPLTPAQGRCVAARRALAAYLKRVQHAVGLM